VKEDILDLLMLTLFVSPVLAGIPGLLFKKSNGILKHYLPVSLAVLPVVIFIDASVSVRG